MNIIAYRIVCANAAGKATKEKRISKEILSKNPVTEVIVEEAPKEHTGDPYDDAYRTMLDYCPQLLIPLVNEIFGEHFTKDDKVVFEKDVHMQKEQSGGSSRRAADSSFEIVGIVTKTSKRFLVEEQTRPDSSILARIFEYALLCAREHMVTDGNVLRVEFPNCAVLFLRSTKKTPDKMSIEFGAQTGIIPIDVLVMKLKDYTLDEMINKDLLILFPFYLFRFNKGMLKEYNQDPVLLESIVNDYARIREHLTQKVANGELDEYYRRTLIELCRIVAENLARHYKNIVKGVQSVMGGKAIETEAWTILNKGRQEGIAVGREEGIAVGREEGRAEGREEGIAVGREEGRQEERVKTEREHRKAEAAEQRANAAEERASAAEQETKRLREQLNALQLQNGLKPAQQ
ncbi:MAG: hypothetical protein LUI87_18380 [Lachnospiraceae bacterium]|nr:hypothetical protein [Lachnospiraceae bacterium]